MDGRSVRSYTLAGEKGVTSSFPDTNTLADNGDLFSIKDDGSASNLPPPTEWLQKYKFSLKNVEINKRHKSSCVVTTKLGELSQMREIIFYSQKEAIAFCDLIRQQKSFEKERERQKFKLALGDIKLGRDENIDFLIEIVGAEDLPVADLLTSDPLVKVYFQDNEVHRTKHICSNLNPIWSVATSSLFLWSVSAKVLFESEDGLTFLVQDFDKFGSNDNLGAITVSPKKLYEWSGERRDFLLRPLHGKDSVGKSTLALRCRRATDYDKKFMHMLTAEKKGKHVALGFEDGLAKVNETAGGTGGIKSILTKHERTEKFGPKGELVTKYLLRPGPDPKRQTETEWMTKQALQTEAMKESHHWFDTGSGEVGRVFFEVIGCDGLPQLDAGGILGNKSKSIDLLGYLVEDNFRYMPNLPVKHCILFLLSSQLTPFAKLYMRIVS